jgi:hypothetical protein
MKKGCILTLGIGLGLVVGTLYVVYAHFKNQFDPVYHGKRIRAWAEQAIRDEDVTTRREAVQILLEALEDMEGEPRTQLLYYFAGVTEGNGEHTELPRELLPFLVRAMKDRGAQWVSGYSLKARRRAGHRANAYRCIAKREERSGTGASGLRPR